MERFRRLISLLSRIQSGSTRKSPFGSTCMTFQSITWVASLSRTPWLTPLYLALICLKHQIFLFITHSDTNLSHTRLSTIPGRDTLNSNREQPANEEPSNSFIPNCRGSTATRSTYFDLSQNSGWSPTSASTRSRLRRQLTSTSTSPGLRPPNVD